MMLEVLEIETTVRGRQSRVAADVQACQRELGPGPLRRYVGNLLVRIGEALRGTTERGTELSNQQIAPAN